MHRWKDECIEELQKANLAKWEQPNSGGGGTVFIVLFFSMFS